MEETYLNTEESKDEGGRMKDEAPIGRMGDAVTGRM
jgi:hypothetical protein